MADEEQMLTPLYADEDETTLLERWRGWANEGLDPQNDVDQWTDTREGSHWYAATTPPRREFARAYDFIGSEVVATAFPQYAWGEWLDDHAELRQLDRLAATKAAGVVRFTAPEGTEIAAGTIVSVIPVSEDDPAPEFETTESGVVPSGGSLDLPVLARLPGTQGMVGAGAITGLVSPVDGVVAVTNPQATFGGTDTESDTALSARVVESFEGSAVANQLYYRRIALNEPGVGLVTVVPVANGPGTVAIIVSTADGGPVSPAVVESLQAKLDPFPGTGAGEGQTNAAIVVSTSTTLPIDVAFSAEFEPGYSLDGTGGTIALRQPMKDVIAGYLSTVQTGGEVVRQQVAGRIVQLRGVHDMTLPTLNGSAQNIQIPSSPPQRPALGELTVTVGSL